MFGIGLPEMILILALALIVVGPDKLPDLARSVAKGIMELKKTAEGLKESMSEEGNLLDDVKPDLEEAAKTFKNHLLDHPTKGSTSLFPPDGVNNPEDNAAQAYAELTKDGIDTSGETIELSSSDLTPVAPKEEPVSTPPAPADESTAEESTILPK